MIVQKKILPFILIVLIGVFYGCGLYYNYDGSDADSDTINGAVENNIKSDKEHAGSPGGINNGYENTARETSAFTVKEVVDGDTIILLDKSRIRFIGINAPEYGMYFFEEASEAMEAMVSGKEVNLEKDISEKDKYGRLLRYVYVENLFVNLEMLKRGFANVYTYPPDVKHNDEFLKAERYARENNLGLWEKSGLTGIEIIVNYDAPGDDSKNLNGEYVIIKNTGADIINTGGWTIKDSATNIYKFGRYLLKPGDDVYLFTGNGKDGEGRFYWGSHQPVWNNDHDTLYLRDSEGFLIEIYDY
jgi:micrococcal nuclease